MTIFNNKTIVRGTLTAIVADNLSSHQIGGFKMGFSKGLRKCRFCLGSAYEIQNKYYDFQFTARTRHDHDLHCSGLAENELRETFARLYGITRKCIFNELQYFNVIGGLPPDIMHDLLEGVLPRVICELLIYCIRKKFVSLKEINHLILNFKYGHAELTNKPSEIELSHLKNKRLRQTAAQIWLLGNLLPLMIGVRIPKLNSRWLCFTTLLEIMKLVFLNSITNLQILQLESLVEEFLSLYKSSFKNKITPKMHHLIHYPRMIRQMGPLTAYWCMRYEAKHKYFKQLQQNIGNFINVPFTLAIRHQEWHCLQQWSSIQEGGFLKLSIAKPKGSSLFLASLSYGGQVASFF